MRIVPTLFIRYEDLESNPSNECTNLLRFVMHMNSLKDSNAENLVAKLSKTKDLHKPKIKFTDQQVTFC